MTKVTFYKETNFIETPVGKIPQHWRAVRLGDVILDIADGGTPSTKIKEHFTGYLPWVNIEDITRDIYDTRRHLSELGLKNSSAKLWNVGTVIFSFGASIGKVGIARVKLCTKQGIAGIVPNSNIIDNEFLYYVLLKQAEKIKQIGKGMGSTITEVRPAKLKKLAIFPLPPNFDEQQKITEVLSTVDEAIQKTNEVIAKTERLKKGLMQELLTKGVGHNEFKDTEIGRIPKEWGVVRLGDIAVDVRNGLYKPKGFYGEGYGIVRMTEFFRNDVLEIEKDMLRVQSTPDEVSKYALVEDDLLFARRSLKPEGSGKCVMVPEVSEPILFESSIIRIRLNAPVAFPKFYFYWVNSPVGRKFITRTIRTVAVSGVTGSDLKRLRVPFLPQVAEQQEIAQILSTVDKKLELERNEKAKLERIKQGMMDTLLTGKIRVKVESYVGK
jgi:type I restriction enzyme S subunit